MEIAINFEWSFIAPTETAYKGVTKLKSLAVSAEGKLSFVEIPIPDYGPCQALVKMKSCGVCNGTDTKIIHRSFKNFDTYPAILGHEGVGEVVEVGEKVESLHVGDLVLLPFLEKETEGFTPGWGAFSQYGVVGDAAAYLHNGMGPGTKEFSESYYAQTVLRNEDKVDAVGASMIITFREVLSAVRRFGIRENTSAVVFGAGPVGLCFIKFLKLLGVSTVISVDINNIKKQETEKMGADLALNSTEADVNLEVRALFPEGVDYVIDAVGLNRLINQAMELVRYNGKICCYGISPKLGMDLDWSKAPYNWDLHFVQWPSKYEEFLAHSQIMAWINAGVLNPYGFISDVLPFEKTIEAFQRIEDRVPNLKKMVVRFD